MTAKTKYTSERIGEYRVVPDFLPSPDELAFRDEGVKVTIALSKRSVEFFKSHAAKNQTQYQRMIRQLLDAYVDAYAQPPTRRSNRTARKPVAR
jgi:predicted DNA binding CopG/RHH family protein